MNRLNWKWVTIYVALAIVGLPITIVLVTIWLVARALGKMGITWASNWTTNAVDATEEYGICWLSKMVNEK